MLFTYINELAGHIFEIENFIKCMFCFAACKTNLSAKHSGGRKPLLSAKQGEATASLYCQAAQKPQHPYFCQGKWRPQNASSCQLEVQLVAEQIPRNVYFYQAEQRPQNASFCQAENRPQSSSIYNAERGRKCSYLPISVEATKRYLLSAKESKGPKRFFPPSRAEMAKHFFLPRRWKGALIGRKNRFQSLLLWHKTYCIMHCLNNLFFARRL